jgi:hypothetical protein
MQTPEVRYETSVVLWVVLFVIVLIFVTFVIIAVSTVDRSARVMSGPTT